jgi:hypothetical protein
MNKGLNASKTHYSYDKDETFVAKRDTFGSFEQPRGGHTGKQL